MSTAFFVLLFGYLTTGAAYSFYAVHVWCTEEKRSLVARFVAFPLNRGGEGWAPLAEILLDGHRLDWTFGRIVYQIGVALFWPMKTAMIIVIAAMYAPYILLLLVALGCYLVAHALGFNPAPKFSRVRIG